MIRVILFLLAVGVLAFGVAWLADRPGDVTVTWQGWRIETSLMVLTSAIAGLIAVILVLWSLLRHVVSIPRRWQEFWQRRRATQGYQAISRGMVAIGAGDADAASRHANDAARLAPSEPLTLLLGAQAAQMTGDRTAAEAKFRAMAGRDDTKLLGLRGLFVEAQRRGDPAAAKLFAEEAARSAPSLAWAGHAVLQLRSAAGDWVGALEILDRNRRTAAIGKADYRRKRAVLLTARALSLEESDRDTAKALALEAANLAPDFVPAAALAGRFLAEAGDLRKSLRLVRTAWKANPHPDLADTYMHARFGDTARERLARAQALAAETPSHPEAAIAVARAALDAREFELARAALAPVLEQPTRRVALLMAEIERTEHGDEGRAREWMARAVHAARDAVWTADGIVSDRWLPMSPVSGRLDAFEWRVPVAELPSAGQPEARDISAGPTPPPVVIDHAAESENDEAAKHVPDDAEEAQQSDTSSLPPAGTPRSQTAGAAAPVSPAPEIVVPIVHAPDDPGPDPEPDTDPGRSETQSPGWRGLFR